MMKYLLAIYMTFASTFALADAPTAPIAVKGEVLEVKDVESYTYLLLKTKDGENWAAVNKSPVKKGAEVTIENVMLMNNFESKSLKKTFKTIYFGTLGGAGSSAGGTTGTSTSVKSNDMVSAHASLANPTETADIHVPKATGTNARTVAEIMTKDTELKGQTVLVRGKVVKYNPEIMGKNWIHLRDGSGSTKDNTNDILVTTKSQAKLGDIVTVKGVVRTNQDFGAGYSYKVLIEEAMLQQ